MANRHYKTLEEIGLLAHLQNWNIYNLPVSEFESFPIDHRKSDFIAVLASGCPIEKKMLNGNLCIGGIDIVAFEKSPFVKPYMGKYEENVNVYHFTLSRLPKSFQGKEYLIQGPYYHDALFEHWPKNQEALDFYSSVGNPSSPIVSKYYGIAGFE